MRAVLLGGLLALLLAVPARAQRAADTLRIAWRDAIPNVDPYYNTQRTGLVLAHEAWDTLVDRDPDTFQLKPLLALSWTQVDDTTIDFTLRPNLRFHDGSPFTAADVAYTVNTVIADPYVAVPGNYDFLAGAEALDPMHVRIKLKRVFPAALEYLAITLPIWPQAYRTRVGAGGYSRAPVGTGPYRITKVDGLHEIDLERNEDYFAGPKGRPAIRRLQIQEVPDADSEIAALLNGQADWIWMFSADQFPRIDAAPALVGLRSESMRLGYLSLDAAGRTGADNPLTKLKVRQAIFHAIDRQSMVRQLVGGGARVLDAPCYPTQFGCDAGAAVRYDYDPAAAKRLLAEAGYPDGFGVDLVAYVLPRYAQAIQGYLKAVGIDARLLQLPVAQAVQRSADGQAPLYAGSWGSYSINDVSAILPYFFAGGSDDYAHDPQVARLIDQGGTTTDPDDRRVAYSAAIRRITEQAYWLPLHTYATTYAFTRELNFKPHPDELPRFYGTAWR